MKRYNRFDHHMILLGIIIPFLVFFISMNATFAYFTATAAKNESSSETAMLKINFSADTVGEVYTSTQTKETKILPGDTLKVVGALENSGTADCYVVLEYEIKITKQDSSYTETVKKEYYTLTDSGWTEVFGTPGNYTPIPTPFSCASGSNSKAISFEHTFDAAKYDNSYKNATVKYSLSANAIQTTNITTTQAMDILMENVGYTTSKIYGNSIQNGTPSIENPAEIQSVGDKTVNLCNIDDLLTNNVLTKNDNNSYSLIKSTAGRFSAYQNLSLSAGTMVTLSLTTLNYTGTHNYKINALFTQKDGGAEYLSISKTAEANNITLNEDIVSFRLYMHGDNPDGAEIKFQNLQLEIGSTATAWEPYGKYKIPVNIQGKNLFDLEHMNFTNTQVSVVNQTQNEIVFTNPTGSANYISTTDASLLNLKPNTTYTTKAEVMYSRIQTGGTSAGSMSGCFYLQTKASWAESNKYEIIGNTYAAEKAPDGEFITVYKTFTTPADISSHNYLATRLLGYSTVTFKNIMLVEGSYTSSTFPYSEFNPCVGEKVIYLNEPLRRIGDVADYIDLETGEVVRQVKSVVLDSSKVASIYRWNGTTGVTFRGYLDRKTSRIPGMCNHVSNVGAYYNNYCMWLGVDCTMIYWIGVLDKLNITTLDEFKTWLDSHRVELIFALKTPTTTEKIEPLGIDFDLGYTITSINTTIAPSN